MKRTSILIYVLALSALMHAGTLSGHVTGATGKSVVYLDAPGKQFPAPTTEPVMDQHALSYQPHVLVVQSGTTVRFQNSDTVQHNVFWPSIGGDRKAAHNLGTWPKGESKPFKFDKPGVVPVLCNVHPEMNGYIVVSPTPYFAETDDAGNYTIPNVPDGAYKVYAWHEGSKAQSKPATVNGATRVDLELAR